MEPSRPEIRAGRPLFTSRCLPCMLLDGFSIWQRERSNCASRHAGSGDLISAHNKVNVHGPSAAGTNLYAKYLVAARCLDAQIAHAVTCVYTDIQRMTTTLERLTSSLLSLSPAQWVQTLFILTSCSVLAITVAPAAERKLLLNYGARRSHDEPATKDQTTAAKDHPEDSLFQAVRKLTSLGQVPHSWFFTYYVFYILCAEAWAVQYFMDGPHLLGFLASRQVETTPNTPTVTGSQIVMLWIMMFVQAARRLYECFVVMKPSKSTMWFVHWVLGLGYYFGVSVAIWIEGSGMFFLYAVLADRRADALNSCHSAE